MKNHIYFDYRYFALSLYRTIYFKGIKIVSTWPRQSSSFKDYIYTCNYRNDKIRLSHE